VTALILVVTASVAGIVACGSTTDPLPKGAVPLVPRVIYATYWSEVEQCSGETADFSAVKWYYVPGDGGFQSGTSADVVGVWEPGPNTITLAEYVIDNPLVVRHEMLHAVLKRVDHPAEYFVDRCGVLVSH
jgi:hypothetical protein